MRDNILTGGHCRSRSGFVANALRLPIVGREERLSRAHAAGLLEEPPAGLNHADLAELGRLIIKLRAWPDVSLRLGVGRCNWSGGRNDGGADDLSRPRYDERGIQEIDDRTNDSSLVAFQAPLHQCLKAIP